jgi:peptide/nickel transport system substrate-binding protein
MLSTNCARFLNARILAAFVAIAIGCCAASAWAQPKQIDVAFETLGKETTDPYFAGGRTDDALLTPYVENLVRVGEDGQIEPALATSWQVSPDGLAWTLHLRPNVKMHDGTVMNADDVKFSFENAYDKRYGPIVALRKSQIGDVKVEIVDNETITIHLQAPNSQILNYLAIYAVPITSKEYFEKVGPEEFARHPVGTGPFRFVEGKKGSAYVFERFADYWGDKAAIDRLVFQLVPDASTRIAMLRSGDVDVALPVASPYLGQLANDSGIKLFIQKQVQLVETVALDPWWPENAPLKDPRVRQALTYAVDREAISKAIFQGYAAPAPEINAFDPLLKGQGIDMRPLPYDVDKARELLAEAGYKNGFKFHLLAPALWRDYAQVVTQFWKKIGVEADLEVISTSTWYSRFVEHVDSMRGAQVTFFAGFNGLIENSFLSYCMPGSPYSFYKYEEHDKFALDIGKVFNDAERRKLIHEAAQSVSDKACYIAPIYVDWGIAASPSVSGIKTIPGWGGLIVFPESLTLND